MRARPEYPRRRTTSSTAAPAFRANNSRRPPKRELPGGAAACPAPVADRHNSFLGELNGKPACIVSRLSGKSLLQPDAPHCSAVGAMLGQMHIAGQSFGKSMNNARGTAWRAQAALEVQPFLDAHDAALLEAEVAFHEQHGLHELPQGVVHADLFRDNVLFDGARIGGLIDFYLACHHSTP